MPDTCKNVCVKVHVCSVDTQTLVEIGRVNMHTGHRGQNFCDKLSYDCVQNVNSKTHWIHSSLLTTNKFLPAKNVAFQDFDFVGPT